VDELSLRLRRGMRAMLERARHRERLADRALAAASPLARLSRGRNRLERLDARLRDEIRHRFAGSRHRLGSAVGRLDSLSPLAVLGRGYSLTRTATGEIVRSVRQVKIGEDVRVLLDEGSLEARVAATRERDDRPQV
jgi:exodeoxyribonuclease VII large subunit